MVAAWPLLTRAAGCRPAQQRCIPRTRPASPPYRACRCASRAPRAQPRRVALASSVDEVNVVSFASTRPGNPGCDLLQQPTVAVPIAERGVRGVTLPRRVGAAYGGFAGGTVEHFAHIGTTFGEIGARCLNVGHDQKESLCRGGHGRRDTSAEVDRARRPWRRELYTAKRVPHDEVGVRHAPEQYSYLSPSVSLRSN